MSGFLTIQVTQEHIDDGVRKSACNCPIALALLEICHNPTVGLDGQMTLRYAGIHRNPQSRLVDRFVRRFDFGLSVEPFTFRIGI